MASNLMRVVASSVAIAQRAGHEIRMILKSGNLAVVDKVSGYLFCTGYSFTLLIVQRCWQAFILQQCSVIVRVRLSSILLASGHNIAQH